MVKSKRFVRIVSLALVFAFLFSVNVFAEEKYMETTIGPYNYTARVGVDIDIDASDPYLRTVSAYSQLSGSSGPSQMVITTSCQVRDAATGVILATDTGTTTVINGLVVRQTTNPITVRVTNSDPGAGVEVHTKHSIFGPNAAYSVKEAIWTY